MNIHVWWKVTVCLLGKNFLDVSKNVMSRIRLGMLDPEDEGIVIFRNYGIRFIDDANLESFGVCCGVGAVETDE
jgi:hypothetical protein